MKNYQVTVNGVVYQVSVEEIVGDAPVATAPVTPAAPVTIPAAAPKAAPVAGGTPVKAPMPGTINKINAKAGDSVKKGDVLCVLEAMKMENDICAPADGKVLSVAVSQGAAVATDEVLFTIG